MQYNYTICDLPNPLKSAIFVFIVLLSVGYFSAVTFVNETTEASTIGIVENYNGNESDMEATEMKFKKSAHEMLNIIHTHILSMSQIFFMLAVLVFGCKINLKLKYFLMLEPMISVLLTFGGIYGVWCEIEWMSYLVMASGFLMSLSFGLSVIVIILQLKPSKI